MYLYYRNVRIFLALIILILLSSHQCWAQQKSKIILRGANSMKNLKVNGQEIIRYIGNVKFEYEKTVITCDSAYSNPSENWFNAYRNVVVSQENSKLYGDVLYFDGKTSLGKLTGREVRLVDEEATLVTDIMYFNSKTGFAYYNSGGSITTKDSRLTSQRGYYDRNKSNLAFAGNVEMHNADGQIFTDSLRYDTKIKLASFFGPTFIYNKDNFVYCENGWYNRSLEQSSFQTNAYLINGAQKLFGDNIFYDKVNGYARALGQVVVVDTANNTYVYGDKANYWDKKKEAEVTDNPYVMMLEGSDTLFLRSDKLFLKTIKDSTINTPDSTYRLIKAIGDVKFYRSDVQGVCDSMIFNTLDSTLTMHIEPVLWNDVNQMSANHIKMYSSDKKIKQIDFDGAAFVASFEEKDRFSQMQGKKIYARFTNGKLAKLDVVGNGQTVYYTRENDTITMVNRAECSSITILVKNNKPSRISYREKVSSNFYPVDKIDKEEVTLKGFRWLDGLRPLNKYSIVPKTLTLFPDEKGKNHKFKDLSLN